MNKNSWITYEYEKGMFLSLPALLNQAATRLPKEIHFSIVESMLLHTRNLVDILLSRGSESDDIKLNDLLPNFESISINRLKDAYGSRNEIGSPCWTINKMLVHQTKYRTNYYDYSPILSEINPLIHKIITEIEEKKHEAGITTEVLTPEDKLMWENASNNQDEEIDFSSFFNYLQTDKGHEVATRVLTIFEDLKKAGIDNTTRRVKFEKWLQVIIIGAVIIASSLLTYFNKFDATIGVLFGALVGYFFGKR